jgi:hypothetical protein
MRDLIARVNSREKQLDISTFSKASKTRNITIFEKILALFNSQAQKANT